MHKPNREAPGLLPAILLLTMAAASLPVLGQSRTDGQVSFRPPRGAMIAPGPAADLTLLYTGDVIGYVDPCG